MRSPTLALAWQLWGRHRWGLAAAPSAAWVRLNSSKTTLRYFFQVSNSSERASGNSFL